MLLHQLCYCQNNMTQIWQFDYLWSLNHSPWVPPLLVLWNSGWWHEQSSEGCTYLSWICSGATPVTFTLLHFIAVLSTYVAYTQCHVYKSVLQHQLHSMCKGFVEWKWNYTLYVCITFLNYTSISVSWNLIRRMCVNRRKRTYVFSELS
jgi:hypothetical protein